MNIFYINPEEQLKIVEVGAVKKYRTYFLGIFQKTEKISLF